MKKQSVGLEAFLPPEPVTLKNLRRHFKEVYGFNLSQTEIMLESSSKSLLQAFGGVSEALKKTNPQEQLGAVFHGLKGLFLNMGENEWAAFARDVEEELKTGVPCFFDRIVADMQVGLAVILFYCRDKGKEGT
jgi:hypothetical protein